MNTGAGLDLLAYVGAAPHLAAEQQTALTAELEARGIDAEATALVGITCD